MKKTWCVIALLKMKILEEMCAASSGRDPVPADSQQGSKNLYLKAQEINSTIDLN